MKVWPPTQYGLATFLIAMTVIATVFGVGAILGWFK